MAGYFYFLIAHLLAFALFTGVLVADIIAYRQLWPYWQTNDPIAKVLFTTTVKHTRLMGISLGIALLAGILMMSQMHQVYGPQLWIRIKIALVIVIVVLRVFNARSSSQLKKQLHEPAYQSPALLQRRIGILQWTQLLLVVAIIVLSVQKFN